MSRELDALIAELLATWIHLKQARTRRHGAQALLIRRQLNKRLGELIEMMRDRPRTGAIEVYAGRLASRHERNYSINPAMLKLLRLIEQSSGARLTKR